MGNTINLFNNFIIKIMDIFETIVTPIFFNYHCIKQKNVNFAIIFTYYLN
jgi:hypothetical protein